jgi:putative GTP pyrophosphokinase
MGEERARATDLRDNLKMQYEERKVFYEKLVVEVLFVLGECINENKVKIHSLVPRETKIKTFESFYKKVMRHNVQKNEFENIEDIAGVRVICLYRSDLERIGSIIAENFEVIRVDTSRTRTEAPFGYASDHYIVNLSKTCKGPRYDKLKHLKCEIQVRTLLMDAWASVSHHLDYKQEIDIPKELRTDFNALSGLFYVADTHFDLFRKGFEEARANLMKSVHQDIFNLDQEINLDSLAAFFKWKFPERREDPRTVSSDIVLELKKNGYENIGQLDDKINIALPMLKKSENEIFQQEKWKPKWHPDGLIRHSLDLTDDKYFKKRPMPAEVRERTLRERAELRLQKK